MTDDPIIIPRKRTSYHELTDSDRELVDAARRATSRAYAPYSHFHVGAAIRLSDGSITEGSNQENAAFPSGTCAERTAAYYAHSAHPDARFEAIAISANGTDGQPTPTPTPPCGACRQALLEYEKLAGQPVRVILDSPGDIYILPSVSSLLPLSFSDF